MKRKIIIIISFLLFISILICYKIGAISDIDNVIYNLVIGIKCNFITDFMKFITFFAGTKFIVFCIIFLFILSIKYKRTPLIFNMIIIGEVILNNIVKVLVKRNRPNILRLVSVGGYSFPSGHTMVSVIFYGFIIYLVYKSNFNKLLKIIICSGLIILMLLIMISRIYLGVHYFTDIVGGICLSLSYLILVIDVLERKKLV